MLRYTNSLNQEIIVTMHMEEKITPTRPDKGSSSRTSFSCTHRDSSIHQWFQLLDLLPVIYHPRRQLFNPFVPYKLELAGSPVVTLLNKKKSVSRTQVSPAFRIPQQQSVRGALSETVKWLRWIPVPFNAPAHSPCFTVVTDCAHCLSRG